MMSSVGKIRLAADTCAEIFAKFRPFSHRTGLHGRP
jgi:hypothetical protein